uniref:Uncharacterized protein n=1 Tax=Arundo donax TaxID=35708 RepID=A0A0A9GE03_ARUDO
MARRERAMASPGTGPMAAA